MSYFLSYLVIINEKINKSFVILCFIVSMTSVIDLRKQQQLTLSPNRLSVVSRRKADEVHILEETIRARNEQHKKAGIELDATCHICLKTKFADGVGHLCNYCSIRCCARCGGKVTLRSNKVSFEEKLLLPPPIIMYLQQSH